ncbi:MAG TPA: hypothetical protein VFS16_15380 [Acidimicrobiia bacterium]|nr:hypothetical protein [Acidimicrobiia bacterium]
MRDEQHAPGTDHETGLPDGSGWTAVLEAEELRARRYGGTHGLIAVRLSGPAADRSSANRVAHTVACAVRDIDLLARVDRATFGVLALHCGDLGAIVARIRAGLDAAGVAGDTTVESRSAGSDLQAAWASLLSAPTGPAVIPARRHVDFVVRSQLSLN